MSTPDPAPPASVPVCYRHGDRETWIRCTRCERPICPDCMHDAAVGFQCPECVREGNRGVRPARTALGARADGTARLTWVLLGLSVVAYLGQLAEPLLTTRFLMVPLSVGDGGYVGVAAGEWWRLLTAAFLHDPDNPAHLGLNMVALAVIGPTLEVQLGRWRFLSLYLASAMGASVAGLVLGGIGRGSLGASGAVFGLFGAALVIGRRLRWDTSSLLVMVGIGLVLGFVLPRIDWIGHVGGLLVGATLGAAYAYAPRARRDVTGLAATAAVVVVLLALTAWRVAQIRSLLG